MKIFRLFVFSIVILLIACAFPSASQAKDGAQLAAKGLSFFQKRKYAEAFKLLCAAEKTRSADPSLEYYLGVSALYSGNQAVGRRALSRCVVLSTPNNTFHKQALAMLNSYFRVQPYSCRGGLGSHSWSKKAMPVRIYCSDGKMLPVAFRKASVSAEQMSQVTKWAQNPSFVSRLEDCPGYRSAHKQAVRSAAQWWTWATGEGLLSFQFVQDPSKADILVFFYPSPVPHSQSGHTNATSRPKDATVIQLRPDTNTAQVSGEDAREQDDRFTAIAAHEFGHAWGLDHSKEPADLMFYQGSNKTGGITDNDKQSLRGLYAGTNELTHMSVGK